MFLPLSKTARWRKAFRAAHPCLEQSAAEPERLRLVLGVGRSGTSWVGQVLSKAAMRCRCFSEPLFHLKPPLPFHKKADHTAVGYEDLSPEHPLLCAWQLLANRQFGGPDVQGLERNDSDWEICLVKEVHALLGSEGLLRLWKVPTVFILRDPVYIADSLFAAQTLRTIYLEHEAWAVRQKAFLDRFVPGRQAAVERLFAEAAGMDERQRIILGKVMCIHLLDEMFLARAAEFPCARALRYEDLCAAPHEAFPALAAALSIPWDAAMAAYLARTTEGDANSDDPYSVMRHTARQKDRPFKFLSAAEVASCRNALRTMKGDSGGAGC